MIIRRKASARPPTRCPLCSEAIGETPRVCDACKVSVHDDCAVELARRGCPTLGCDRRWGRRTVRASPMPQYINAVANPGTRQAPPVPKLGLLSWLGLGASALGGVASLAVVIVATAEATSGLEAPGAAGRRAAEEFYALQPTIDAAWSAVATCVILFSLILIIAGVRAVVSEVEAAH